MKQGGLWVCVSKTVCGFLEMHVLKKNFSLPSSHPCCSLGARVTTSHFCVCDRGIPISHTNTFTPAPSYQSPFPCFCYACSSMGPNLVL
jgi:hypothetical protein